MKKTLMWCLIGLLSVGSAAWLQAQQTGGTEKAVTALEQQRLQSQRTNNPGLLAPLLADKYETFTRLAQEDQVVISFQTYIGDFMTSYKTDRREHVSWVPLGWSRSYYQPIGAPEIDVKRTDSLVSPYVGICEFTLLRSTTAFHKTKEEAAKDDNFVDRQEMRHRHRYGYQGGKWAPRTREHVSPITGKLSDCNEVIMIGKDAGADNIFGCWEKN
jgi:hypothetical protein